MTNDAQQGHPPHRPTSWQALLWLGILLMAVIIALANWTNYQIGVHFDDARYIVLAHSLLGPSTYGMVNLPDVPGPGKYPFGFPLFLVPSLLLAPDSWDALKIASLLATLGIATLLFWGWRSFSKTTSYGWALAVTTMTTLSPLTTSHMRRVMSEPLFTLFCLLSILLAEQYASGRRRWWWSAAMSFALVFTLYTRTIGIVLVFCVFVYLFRAFGKSFLRPTLLIGVQSAALLALVVALTPVQLRDLLPLEYLNDENARFFTSAPAPIRETGANTPAPTPAPANALSDGVGRGLSRLRVILLFGMRQHLGSDVRNVALPFGGGDVEARIGEAIGIPALPQITGYLVSALVLLGFVQLFRHEKPTLFLIFAAVYFVALFLWVWNDPRLLYPIQPQIFFALLMVFNSGVRLITRLNFLRGREAWHGIPRISALACITVALILAMVFKSYRDQNSRTHTGDLELRTQWTKAHTNTSDVLATNAPEIDFLYGGRKTVFYPEPVPANPELAQYFDAHHVAYVLLAPEIEWQPEFQPFYSETALALEKKMNSYVASGKATVVFEDVARKVRVYHLAASLNQNIPAATHQAGT